MALIAPDSDVSYCLVYDIPLATFNIKDYLYFKDEHGLALVTA